MLNENRRKLNNFIEAINRSEKRRDLIEVNEQLSMDEFDHQYGQEIEHLNGLLDSFFYEIDKIWHKNLDRSVQISINYYLRKAGMSPRRITATI